MFLFFFTEVSPPRCPLSPIKVNNIQNHLLSSPVKSPLKLSTCLERTVSPLKLNLQQRLPPSSPVKSPRKQEFDEKALLSSPVKSPWKLNMLQRTDMTSPKKSPRKLNFLHRAELSSPVKSPRKSKAESPVKKSPIKSPILKLGKLDCKYTVVKPFNLLNSLNGIINFWHYPLSFLRISRRELEVRQPTV